MNPFQYLVTRAIRLYQLTLSPLVGWHCRYDPSCSEYMRISVTEHGAIRGILMGLKRLSRCHPWGGFGYDPPPQKESSQQKSKQT